jgi:hypothetical protein
MPSVLVRPFRRGDRDQLTRLVNAHAAAVIPGMTASVSAVLGSLERQPGEFIEDPWVSERVTLVAEQRDRVVAAAHLLRYFPDERAGRAARDVGSWLLGQAADWLRLAQVSRLLDYAWLEGSDPGGQSYDDYWAFLPAVGFRELTRTACGWAQE